MQVRRTASIVAALAAVAAVSLVALGTTPAAAGGKHCAVKLQAFDRGEAPPKDAEPTQRCFDSFSKSISYATNGEIQLPENATPRSAKDELSTKSSALLGMLYAGADYGGASKAIYGGGRGCYAGKQYYVDDLSDIGFNNRASSVNLSSNCLGIFYRNKNFDGASFLCEGNCRGLGRLDNEASSINFF